MDMPAEICGDTSDIHTIFMNIGKSFGDISAFANQLYDLLPLSIKKSTAWYNKLKNRWCYDYGEPIHLQTNMIIQGSTQHPFVEYLYLAIKTAKKYVTDSQLQEYLKRIENKAKHQETLFEMRPVLNLDSSFPPKYEVEGFGFGNKKIDWLIQNEKTKILVDVKFRIIDLVIHLEEIAPKIVKGLQSIHPTPPDPSYLFRSAQEKFQRNPPSKFLQGVWINYQIKEDEKSLKEYFDKSLDPQKIHFTVIANWKPDAYFLVRQIKHKELLKAVFNLLESEGFVSNEY